MKNFYRVIIVGGGIAGCALLYQLARRGWTDALLLDKAELTSGSTWHASGNAPHFSLSSTTSRLALETTRFYEQFPEETGEPIGFHRCGAVRLANTPDEALEHRRVLRRAERIGIPAEPITAARVKELFPYFGNKGIVSAVHTPTEGYVDPSAVTHAVARQARALGATISRFNRVTAIRRAGSEWELTTPEATIRCEILVNAAGLWGREIAALVGHRAPMVPFQRQYVVTDPVPGLMELGDKIPVLRDQTAPMYIRREMGSFLIGLYDSEPVFWALDGTPPGFEQELLTGELDRVTKAFENAIEDVPILGTLGVRRLVNGPIMRTADGHPLIGPVPGIPNYFLNTGHLGGFTVGPALMRYLAEWIIDGEPSIDLSAVDARRFGCYATADHVMRATRSTYAHEFGISYPRDEHYAGLDGRTSALHDLLKESGAVFGARNGWELPNWFARNGEKAADELSFRRSNWFEPVVAESRAVLSAGIADVSSLSKFSVEGPGVSAPLRQLLSMPADTNGRGMLATPKGRPAAFVDVLETGRDRFYLTASALTEQVVLDLLMRALPADARIANLTSSWGALLVVGSKSADILAEFLGGGEEAEMAERFGRIVDGHILPVPGLDVPAKQIHCEAASLRKLYKALKAASGAPADIGMRALDALRLASGLPRWGAEIGPSTSPALISMDGIRVGQPLSTDGQDTQRGSIVLLRLEPAQQPDADPSGGEGVYAGDKLIGLTSSGGFCSGLDAQLAFAFIDKPDADTTLTVELNEQRIPASIMPSDRPAPVWLF